MHPRPLASQRHLFDIPDDVTYLNCAYLSPSMKQVVEAGKNAVALKSRPWEIQPQDFFTASEEIRATFAGLLNATANDIAIVPSVSYGAATAAKNISLSSGQDILCLEDQFPSNIYPWRRLAQETGARLLMIPRTAAQTTEGGMNWTAAILDALGGNTGLVALPHCHWTDGALIDLEAVGTAARQHGAVLFLDLTQSAGALPFNIQQVQPDFLVAAGYKWLLGPYSLGYFYAAPRWQEGKPLEENWISRARSEDFAQLVDYQDAYQPGARRFDMGERSNFHLLPMALVALKQIAQWTIPSIATTLLEQTRHIAHEAQQAGWTTLSEAERAPHFLGLRAPDGLPDGLVEHLRTRKIHVSVRGSSVRITPHLYNTTTDAERLLQALTDVPATAATTTPDHST